jgi:hypothetical protein
MGNVNLWAELHMEMRIAEIRVAEMRTWALLRYATLRWRHAGLEGERLCSIT